jgi:hypothetical protein
MCLAPLNYSRFFKKVFSEERIAKSFLEDFLDVTIEEFEMLKDKYLVTQESLAAELDFRCKIDNSYVIIDMQHWYKRDLDQRYYLYHAMNEGLQLEKLPVKSLQLKDSPQVKNIKDYRSIEPVWTLIWLGADNQEFTDNYMTYTMTPAIVSSYLKNDALWHKQEIKEII